LIEFARSKGVKANIVETGTFDIMLSKIWRQLSNKPDALDLKVRTAKAKPVCIPLAAPGKNFPILRTNALAVTAWPEECATIEYTAPLTFKELNDKVFQHKPEAVACYTDRILFWGNSKGISSLLDEKSIRAIKSYNFEKEGVTIVGSTILQSFFENALAHSLCNNNPLKLRRKGRTYYAVIDHDSRDDVRLEPMKKVLGYKGALGDLAGSIRGLDKTYWAEAISIRLEHRNNALWLLIEPDIWVSPLSEREKAVEFLRGKRLRRYNEQSSDLLSEWIHLLFGSIGEHEVSVSCFSKSEYAPTFKLNTRTAFSYRGGANG
jgi:hypothetical protein